MRATPPPEEHVHRAGGRRFDPGRLAAVLLLVTGSCAALSVDVVRVGSEIKGDEATYIAMALSAAYDGDLAYETRDIARFYQLYDKGPSGIFLKRGAGTHDRDDRLYFGKAYIYPIVVAPFVRLAGLNGMLLLHVALLAGMVLTGYVFLAARSPGGTALLYVFAFFGVSIVPLYAVFLTSDFFNIACVSFAYFLWFYKEVAPPGSGRRTTWLHGTGSDLAAAFLLGLATFSKPTHIFLVIPPLALAVSRRRPRLAVAILAVFVTVVAAGFAINAGITGEMNYQGGNRRIFFDAYPFERPGADFEDLGSSMTTNTVAFEERSPRRFVTLLAANLRYFLLGRHFGFLPFFFPGIVAIALYLLARGERRFWQSCALCVVALTAVGLCIYMPYTWSGGGGPVGNRYFVSIYPVLLFLTPPLASLTPAVIAWAGGALFTAHILLNPFAAAKRPDLMAERGLLRSLPIEMTMVNDLPLNLVAARRRVSYGDDPELLLYFPDTRATPPEGPGMWVAGDATGQIIVRTFAPVDGFEVRLESPVPNTVTVSMGGPSRTVEVPPNQTVSLRFEPRGVYARASWSYLMTVTTRTGFVPLLLRPESPDGRYLGTLINLSAKTE